LDIHFETVGTGSYPAIERGRRVLRTERAAAAMCKDTRAASTKERHNAPCSMPNGAKGKAQRWEDWALGIAH
jgi:hypothetical protein